MTDAIHGRGPQQCLTCCVRSFKDAATAFEKFKGKLLVCAGNHDLGWWGSIEKYREFCEYLGLSGDCSVASQLRNDSTTIDLLGLDSTWWCPGLGIAGVGRIDDDELAAAKAFAEESSKGWKMLYLHHRPIEPSLSEETKQSIANGSVDETTALDLRKPFLGLMGAKVLLDTVAGKVDLLTFGHDKDYLTDITDHARPVWVNCNREDSRNGGWLELTFDDKQCTIRAYDDLGQQRREQILSRS